MDTEAKDFQEQLTRDDILAFVDAGARRRRDMSGIELIRAHREGTLDDPCSLADLLVLVDLLAEDDPVFEPA